MMSGFRQFILRGNVIDLAVAVVIGAAFGVVVAALVKDLLTPLIGAIFGAPDFSALIVTVKGSRFLIGDFVNAMISFLLISAAVYYAIIVPVNAINARRNRGSAPLPGFYRAIVPGLFSRSAMGLMIFTAGLMIAIAMLDEIQSFAAWLLETSTGERLVLDFRARLFGHIQRLSLSYHDSKGRRT